MEAFFIEEQLHQRLEEKFQEEAFQDCFLVGIELHKGNKLEVFIDCDSGLNLDTCRQVSRYLEAVIEEEDWFGEKYTLDVSSPGLDKPLKLRRQYVKNIGRTLKVTLEDESVTEGVLEEVGEDSITLKEEVVVKEGKKKKKQVVQKELPFDKIRKTMVVISFR